jgi:enoyl-CoA hydratase/carnithine racemase
MSTLNLDRQPGGAVVTLTLDHGKANEMGSAQLDELEALVAELETGPAVAMITVSRRTSRRGTPIFIAGANVTERGDWTDDQVKAHVRRQRSVLSSLRRAPVFHVAVINGVALGWGTEYLLCCDWRIACDEASFALPETGLGILPGAGGTAELWAHVGVAQAMRLGMTGERIDADEAHRIGLVQERAVDVDFALNRAHELCQLVAKRSPTAVAAFKRAVLDAVGTTPAERQEIEALAYERCVDTGQAAIGRASYGAIRTGERPDWGPRRD